MQRSRGTTRLAPLGLAAALALAPAALGQAISSPDGIWRATLDANGTGQITNLFMPAAGPDHVFETLWYELSAGSGGVTTRVENTYTNTASSIGANSAAYTLLRNDGILRLDVVVTMVNGPNGGALFELTWTNVSGVFAELVKPFAYADLDVNGDAPDDFASWDAASQSIVQTDGPITISFGGVQAHKSWEIATFVTLRSDLDAGLTQLDDTGGGGPADFTAAISGEQVPMDPGQSTTYRFKAGGPNIPPLPSEVSITSASDLESAGRLDFKIALTNPVATDVTVDVTTTPGTATIADGDFDPLVLQTVTIPMGSVTASVVVTVNDDDVVEADETFSVTLSNIQDPTGNVSFAPGNPPATGTIENDDNATISIDDVTRLEGDSGPTPFSFTATLSAPVDVDVTVDYATANGTATAPADYLARSGTIDFPAGPGPPQTVLVQVNGDVVFEPDETFFVNLANLQAQGRDVAIADPQGRGLILNDDDGDTGACCFQHDGSCLVTTPVACATAGGLYQGHDSSCGQVGCPQPATGACCFFDGTCASSSRHACVTGGGLYQGDAVACTAGLCPARNLTGGRGTITGKGSLVHLSSLELRWDGPAPCALRQDTFISLTNDANQDVDVQLYFVNGDPPLEAVRNAQGAVIERAHPGWNSYDNKITLTANQPTYWSLLTGLPAQGGLTPFTALDPAGIGGPGRPASDGTGDRVLRGYAIAWAVDEDGAEVSWNHLAGNVSVVNYALGYAWEYGSLNHAVVTGVAPGTPGDANAGVLSVDGSEYSAAPAELLFDFQAAGSLAFGNPASGAPRTVSSDTFLTLHPLSVDLRQETEGPVTTKASVTVWNGNEVKLSGAHRCVTCWDGRLISLYHLPPTSPPSASHFLRANLQTDHGKARIDGVRSDVCDDVLAGVFSRNAALWGVAARLLRFDPGLPTQGRGAAGSSLVGVGFEAAWISYDLPGGGQEAQESEPPALDLPFVPSRDDLMEFVDTVLGRPARPLTLRYHTGTSCPPAPKELPPCPRPPSSPAASDSRGAPTRSSGSSRRAGSSSTSR